MVRAAEVGSRVSRVKEQELITDRLLLFCSFLSALVLAIVYDLILTKLSLGLVSPYEKADLRKRFFAATVDALVVATAVAGYQATKSLGYALSWSLICHYAMRCRGAVSASLFAVWWSSMWRPVFLAHGVRRWPEMFCW